MEISSSEPDSMLYFSIIREERVKLNGKYEKMNNNFFYKIGETDGNLQLSLSATSLESYVSVLVSVQVQDVSFLSEPIECKDTF